MTGAPERPPWLRFYGAVPESLDYPEATIYEVLARTAGRTPDAKAWDFFGATSTYRDLLAEIDACATGLFSLGLRPRDRILISMPTSPQGVIAFYAANKLGAVAAFTHPLSTGPELTHYLDATGARIALTLDAFYATLAAARPKVPLTRIVIARIPDYLPAAKKIGFWLTKGRKIAKVPADPRVLWWPALMDGDPTTTAGTASCGATDDPAVILFSGGTTGEPKGIVLSNRNFIAEGLQVAAWGGLHDNDAMLAILPLFHGFGLGVCVNAVLMAGGKSILVPTFQAPEVARLLRTARPTVIVGRAHAVRGARQRPDPRHRRPVAPARLLLRRGYVAPTGEGELRESRERPGRQSAAVGGIRPHGGGLGHHGDAARRVSRGLDRPSLPRHEGHDLLPGHER